MTNGRIEYQQMPHARRTWCQCAVALLLAAGCGRENEPETPLRTPTTGPLAPFVNVVRNPCLPLVDSLPDAMRRCGWSDSSEADIVEWEQPIRRVHVVHRMRTLPMSDAIEAFDSVRAERTAMLGEPRTCGDHHVVWESDSVRGTLALFTPDQAKPVSRLIQRLQLAPLDSIWTC
jgi:hypothetical protein